MHPGDIGLDRRQFNAVIGVLASLRLDRESGCAGLASFDEKFDRAIRRVVQRAANAGAAATPALLAGGFTVSLARR